MFACPPIPPENLGEMKSNFIERINEKFVFKVLDRLNYLQSPLYPYLEPYV